MFISHLSITYIRKILRQIQVMSLVASLSLTPMNKHIYKRIAYLRIRVAIKHGMKDCGDCEEKDESSTIHNS
jgi:hypothetical protein